MTAAFASARTAPAALAACGLAFGARAGIATLGLDRTRLSARTFLGHD